MFDKRVIKECGFGTKHVSWGIHNKCCVGKMYIKLSNIFFTKFYYLNITMKKKYQESSSKKCSTFEALNGTRAIRILVSLTLFFF